MPDAPNFLIDEAEQLLTKLKQRIAQRRALLSDNSEEQSRATGDLQRMEKGLQRLQLYCDMLKDDSSHRDQTLVEERNRFGKQYKRRWRPSKA